MPRTRKSKVTKKVESSGIEEAVTEVKRCETVIESKKDLCPNSIDSKECHWWGCPSNCELYRAELEFYKNLAKILDMVGYEDCSRIVEVRLPVIC